METCRDQHILMQTVSLSWHRRKVHLSSTSLATLSLTVPKSMFPGQSTNGKESVILSRCKLMTPSSLSSHSVMEPDWGTGKPRVFSLGSSAIDSVLSGLATLFFFFLMRKDLFPMTRKWLLIYTYLPIMFSIGLFYLSHFSSCANFSLLLSYSSSHLMGQQHFKMVMLACPWVCKVLQSAGCSSRNLFCSPTSSSALQFEPAFGYQRCESPKAGC